MIKITDEMKNVTRSQLADLEAVTDRRIIKAVQIGTNKAVFPLDHTEALFYELKERYESNGYKIIPVGIIGGVRQLDYYIMW